MPAAAPGSPNYDPIGAALAYATGGGAYLGAVQGSKDEFIYKAMKVRGLSQAQAEAEWDQFAGVILDPTLNGDEKAYMINRMRGGGGGGGGRGGGGGGGGGGGISTAQRAAQYAAEIANLAGQFGLEGDWSSLGAQAAANNWSMEMVRDMLADRITLDTAKKAGLVKDIFDRTRAAGGDYFLNFADEELLGYAKRVARNELDQDSIMAEVKERAKAKYHWLSQQIDHGMTMKQMFAPHREMIAQLLEVSADSVDLIGDSKWWPVVESKALNGESYSLNVSDTAKLVRNMEDWKLTKNAKDSAAAAVTSLAKTFGAMG